MIPIARNIMSITKNKDEAISKIKAEIKERFIL
jgi:hypothetical protein